MKHRFKNTCPDAKALLDGCDKISTFMQRINKLSEQWKDNGLGWSADEYKGDAFEALAEVFVNASPIDKRLNLASYEPADRKKHGRDMGVDGYGLSHDGKRHCVQVKYRSNVNEDLTTKDGISNFAAFVGLNPEYRDADLTIITTARGLNSVLAEEMYSGRIRTLGYADLRKMLDKNGAFWDLFRKEMDL
jgi:hypothetical protein